MSSATKTVKSTCRICINCGFEFKVSDNKVISARPDKAYPLSEGYACTKGTDFIKFLQGEGVPRLTTSYKRGTDGELYAIRAETALDEIAEKISALIQEYGPRSIAFYTGTGSYSNTITYGMARSLIALLGTPNLFSTITIDQPQKITTPARMGYYLGGKRSHHDVDVMLTAGNNPLVSHAGNPITAAPGFNPGKAFKILKERGVQHIVIDPRYTETAKQADLYLPILPGEDATLLAGLVQLILQNGWQHNDFCGRWVKNIDKLREATAAFSPDYVAWRCGLNATDIAEAARLFSHAKRPLAGCATGVSMTPYSNLADFLLETLNALCGGYRQEGEIVRNRGMLFGVPPVADVLPPNRTWERGPQCRSVKTGAVAGEFPTALLPDEILKPGKDKIRALIVFSGNPALALVDPDKTKAALQDLDLLITLDNRESETTALSDYVIATSTFYERHELSGYMEFMFDRNFIDYTKPVVEKPTGVIDDWEFFWGVAQRMGLQLEYKYMGLLMDYAALPPGLKINMEKKPAQEEIIAWICAQRGISYQELAQSSGGITYDLPDLRVAAPSGGPSGNRLDVCPDDVAEEIRGLLQSKSSDQYAYRLSSRRIPYVMNSMLRGTPRLQDKGQINYAYMNPEDMKREGIKDGEKVLIESSFAQISGTVMGDKSVRSSVISMAHGFDAPTGAHTGKLVPLADGYREPISFIPHQTAIPVNIHRRVT